MAWQQELRTQMKFSFFQIKVDSKFWQGLPHHFKQEFPALKKVAFLLPVHGDLDRLIQKGFEAFEMVRMRMGQDDKIDFFRGNPILLALMKEVGDMTGRTRIDQYSDLSTDQI